MPEQAQKDLRLIEAGFPCHQVGAETQRERDTGKSPPPNRLHVWWARRPLTPSRAAILASLLPADTDPEWNLKQLGIHKPVVSFPGGQWVITDKTLLDTLVPRPEGGYRLPITRKVLNRLEKESERRAKNRDLIAGMKAEDPSLAKDPVLLRWEEESRPLAIPPLKQGDTLDVEMVVADPAWGKRRIEWENSHKIRTYEDKYGYARAFMNAPNAQKPSGLTVLDPTSGGGSIPFEALRLGHKVIANELNPVATVILHATLEYPAKYGLGLLEHIQKWGQEMRQAMMDRIGDLFPASRLCADEVAVLEDYLEKCPELVSQYVQETLDGFLYCRQVTCPHCGGEAPLLNTCWLSKEDANPWGVRVVPDGKARGGTVRFETYRVENGKGPNGEDPDFATVNKGVGHCVHCRQAVDADEIKRQARGESPHGTWKDRLYCVVAVRLQPKLDKEGSPQIYKSGQKKGEIKTEKIRFFRPPNPADLEALDRAETRLQQNWDHWDAQGLIPTESIPDGHKTKEPQRVGMNRWCDMFTPRQLLGHLTLVEELNRLKPQILESLGPDKGKAVVTYLQFAIDKGVDYNSKQTLWHASRGVIAHTFTRHDYSFKWTFGEMIFSGENSGFARGVDQVIDAYRGIAELATRDPDSTIINGTGANIQSMQDGSVDLVCMDPPYYNNVQYAELSDYFYVWQSRVLKDLYPEQFRRRVTNKQDEAVANPDRDGGTNQAKAAYERMMGEIFTENRRVLKDDGIMTIMFTHKSQDAWETLTRSLIENGWVITASTPVESESSVDIHHKEMAAAVSSIFITCRKRLSGSSEPASWTGFGGTGVQQRIRQAVAQGLEEFAPLNLNPVDEMVASYGRALWVLSEQWPVLDGDEEVGPLRAMNEASRVVAENQIRRITQGRMQVEDLSAEAAMALTLYGIYGLAEFPYDEALNLSRSLNISLSARAGGYTADGRFIGLNTEASAGKRSAGARAEDTGFHAPLVRKGSKLRLAKPEERHQRRLEHPQTEWDILHGVIMAFRKGDAPVARAYLDRHAEGKKERLQDLLHVWAAEMPDDTLRKEADAILFGLGRVVPVLA
ncbi:MAG: DUF1156 domain-containing protein [Deltaproteobacteria bacterium]|nr:DUF1156 domain-containing protein [Deltaproteobacteria bacterium]